MPSCWSARFIAGLPHGAFFGTGTVIAKALADKGREGKAVSVMVTGQTLANMLSVPAGTLLAEYLNWRLAFIILALGAGLTIVLTLAWMPLIAAVPDAGLAGRFRFLAKPGPWLVLGTVFVGNSGVFCWWSYVSPWLQKTGGYDSQLIPLLMMLAGFGMVVGGLAGGHLADRWLHSVTAAVGQSISAAGLLMVFIVPGNLATCALLTFWIAFGLFFINGPQMLLMAEAGKDGGELIGGAAVQIAFNGGNAVGSLISGMALNASGMNYHTIGLAGLPFTLAAVGLLVMFALLYERKKAQ